MKKIPITLLPIVLILIVLLLFTFYVPQSGDLISSKGDYYLGQALGLLTVLSLLLDFMRFQNRK